MKLKILFFLVLLKGSFLLAEEWVLSQIQYSDPRWLNDEEIVYLKEQSFMFKGSYPWDFPTLHKVQICKRNISDIQGEKILLDLVFKHIYKKNDKRGHYTIFENKQFQGVKWIRDINVCLAAQKITFYAEGDWGYKDDPKPKSGIYMMDYKGKGLQHIVDGVKPLFSPDGKKILYKGYDDADQKGLFIYDLESRGNKLITDKKYDLYKWSIDSQTIVLAFKDKPNQYFLYSLQDDSLTEVTYENAKDYSYDRKYWAMSDGNLYFRDEKDKVQKINAPIPFPDLKFKEWNPNRLQYLAQDDRDIKEKIIIIDVPSMKINVVMEEI